MKILTVLLLLALCVQDILCEDSILSKFHQHTYKVRDFRFEIMSYNKKYFRIFEAKTFKHNRTTPAVNLTMNMKITVKDKVEIIVQGFKFLSNEYRHFPVRFQINLKKAVDANVGGLSAIKNCGNISIFSFEKDVTYYVCNFVTDDTQLPPLIPNGRYRYDSQMLYKNEELANVSGFGEIYTLIAYPKN